MSEESFREWEESVKEDTVVISDSSFQWILHDLIPSQTGEEELPSTSGLFDKEYRQPQVRMYVCTECVIRPVRQCQRVDLFKNPSKNHSAGRNLSHQSFLLIGRLISYTKFELRLLGNFRNYLALLTPSLTTIPPTHIGGHRVLLIDL